MSFSRPMKHMVEKNTEEALKLLVIERAKEAELYPALFEGALKAYAEAYIAANSLVPWNEDWE